MNDNLLKILSCPISYQIFNEPVVLSDGITYEKDIVISFIKNKKISPFTGKYLTDNFNCLTTNLIIKQIIDIFTNSKLICKNDIYNSNFNHNNFYYNIFYNNIFYNNIFYKLSKSIFEYKCKCKCNYDCESESKNDFSKIIFVKIVIKKY
jgi:hypothetical protein